MKSLRKILAFLLALGLAFVSAATADANTKGGPSDPISTQMYILTHTNIYNASLFQCPYTTCNQGVVVSTEHPVSNTCSINDSTPWGGNWQLVHNVNNNHVGWISSEFLADVARINCDLSAGPDTHVTIYNASLFQCPYTTCNQGIAQPTDLVVDLCWMNMGTPWGGYWHFVYNRTNRHVGWMSGKFLLNNTENTPCAT